MRIMHSLNFVLPLHHLIQVLYVVYGFVLQPYDYTLFRHIRFDRILLKMYANQHQEKIVSSKIQLQNYLFLHSKKRLMAHLISFVI